MACSSPQPGVNCGEMEDKDIIPIPIALGFGDEFPMDASSDYSLKDMAPNNEQSRESIVTVSSSGRQDVEDSKAERGKCGLYNLGNTCFMNSGLQAVMSTMPLVRFLLKYESKDATMVHTMLGQFHRLFCRMWGAKYSVIYPRDFKYTLSLFHPQFQDYRQHDCQEFLALLLDTLHEQLNNKTSDLTNRPLEAGSDLDNRPMETEPSMNNMSASSLVREGKKDNTTADQSQSAVSSHSGLTFDNMKFAQDDLQISSSPESFVAKSREKNTNRSGIGIVTNLISEDFEQTNMSEHSSDSEQCSVIQNLRLRSSPVISQSETANSSNSLQSKAMCTSVSNLSEFHSVSSTDDMQKVFDGKDSESPEREIEACFSEDLPLGEVGEIRLASDPSLAAEVEAETDSPVLLNNAVSKSASSVPSLDDLYSKETKTLNTNVLVQEYMEDPMAMDSDKFVKQDNVHRTDLEDEVDRVTSLNNEVEAAGKKDDDAGPPRIKDVNIRADKKTRYSKGACGSNVLMDQETDDCFSLKNIKRMKFEGTEKNLQMQELSKINKTRILFGDTSIRRGSEVESESDGEEMDNDLEVSDDESSVSDLAVPLSAEGGVKYTSSEVLSAEEAWQAYLSRNDSIIVSTFQGQFKSTVICSECSHVSVTFEPFMYLSVPIPHAMERQLCVTFVPVDGEVTRYLLVLHKLDKISTVKKELGQLTGKGGAEIIMAEVLDWHISRILEDNTMLRYVNDANRKIYAFEMAACPIDGDSEEKSKDSAVSGLNSSQGTATDAADVFSAMGSFSVSSVAESSSSTSVISDAGISAPLVIDNTGTQSKSSSQLGNQSDWLTCNPGDKTHKSGDLTSYELAGTGMWEWTNTATGSTSDTGIHSDVWQAGDMSASLLTDTAGTSKAENDPGKESSPPATEQWRSCAICLEDLTDNELMVHTSCGGTFCPSCLEMSVQHYGDSSYCCPVCSSPAVMTEDFVPLANAANHKPRTRLVTVPLTFRLETTSPSLFSHPNIFHLPSNLSGEYIYGRVDSLLAVPVDYKIVLTDGQGLHCARCLYMEHCSGCEITRDGEVTLRPGDHLTVCASNVSDVQVEVSQACREDKSMEKQRSAEPVSLYDCLRAFTQSEDLDEHWFCPQCQRNQRAKKTMTVWQYSDTLIIQLKRFMFHELSSTKVDSKVIFPVDNLDLSSFISGPHTKQLQYSLYSIVCHFGGANSGHYTSYAKHPVDGKWYYYNDETVSLQTPGEDDHASTYVLFYQRKGTDMAIQIPDDIELDDYESDHGNDRGSSDVMHGPMVMAPPPEGEVILKPVVPAMEETSAVPGETADCSLDFYS